MPYKDPEKKKQWEREHRRGKQRAIWWGYGYPDTMPDNWRELASESGYELLAMFHDQDVTLDGELKEPHWHIAVRLSHAGTIDDAKEALLPLGVKEPSVQWRDSWRAVARYLCHLDDPNKTQYSPDHVLEFGGADYMTAINRQKDKYRIIAGMKQWVRETDCTSFAKLFDHAEENDMEWFMALCDNCAVIMREYIKSRRYDAMEERNEQRRAAARARLERRVRESEILRDFNEGVMDPDEPDPDAPRCSWCGAPAVGGSVGPDGVFYWCGEHERVGREYTEGLPDFS